MTLHNQGPGVGRAAVALSEEIRCSGGANILVEFSIFASATATVTIKVSFPLLIDVCDGVFAA
jgi:ribosomal protein L9